MTLAYNQEGQVKMICDVCTKETSFYDTLDELMLAVHFNQPITNDYGAVSWTYGPGKQLIGPGYQPTTTVNPKTHACPNCKSNFDTLVFQPTTPPYQRVAPIGDGAVQSGREDAQLNNADAALFKGTVKKFPPNISTGQVDFSHDDSILPNQNPEEHV